MGAKRHQNPLKRQPKNTTKTHCFFDGVGTPKGPKWTKQSLKNRSGQDFDPTWPPRGPSEPISIKLGAILSHFGMVFGTCLSASPSKIRIKNENCAAFPAGTLPRQGCWSPQSIIFHSFRNDFGEVFLMGCFAVPTSLRQAR